MKKIVSLMLVSVMAVSLAGCGTKTETDEYGNTVEVSGTEYTVYPEELPYTIDYDGTTLTLEEIDFYQDESSYNYNIIVIVRFDVSELDDEQLYWLKTEDMVEHPRLTSEDNDLNSSLLYYLGNTVTDNSWYVGYNGGYGKNYRYSFADSELNYEIVVDENEGDDITKRTIEYKTTVPDPVPTTEDMDAITLLCYYDWLTS